MSQYSNCATTGKVKLPLFFDAIDIVRKRCEQRSEAGVMCPATVKSAEVSEFPNKQAASCFYPKARSR